MTAKTQRRRFTAGQDVVANGQLLVDEADPHALVSLMLCAGLRRWKLDSRHYAASERCADTVKRQRIEFTEGFEVAVRRSACAHVILGMDLEKTDIGFVREQVAVVFRFEADTGMCRYQEVLKKITLLLLLQAQELLQGS